MTSSIFLTLALSLCVVMTSAFPSSPRLPSRTTGDKGSITLTSNITTPYPLQAHPVQCLNTPGSPKLIPSDCSYLLNEILLREPNVFTKRRFVHAIHQADSGRYTLSRWRHQHCQISVVGDGFSQEFSFLDVALTANKILSECVNGVTTPAGGSSAVGDASDVRSQFKVILREPGLYSISADTSGVSGQPAASVSRRGIRSQDTSENAGGPQELETRDPLRRVPHVSNRPTRTSNFSLSEASPTDHPVHCFNPSIIHLPLAVATDCVYIINHVILRGLDPLRPMTFGFTDAVDINLLNPEHSKWQHGQCIITLANNDERSIDTFRMLDVVNTARRISTQCLGTTGRKMGGVASIGTDGRGFYVYVGGPLDSSPTLSDVVLLNEIAGLESF